MAETTILADVQVNLFRNSFDSTPIQTLTLSQVIDDIRIGRHRAAVHRVRKILATQGKREYDEAKAKLPAVTFAGTFNPTRGIANLQQHSGVAHGDIDHLPDVAAVKRAICNDPRTAYCFISPSETGLKLGVHVPLVADDSAYKHAWHVVATEYELMYGASWDSSGKDISRLCFVSFDPDCYWNPDAHIFNIPPATAPEPKPTPLLRTSSPRPHHDRQDYAEHAIRTAVQMIQTAPMGTRHSTRLRAARLLGGFVAGGLLTDERAYGVLAQAPVGYTENLPAALKTVKDGLDYGQSHPITPEALEAERQSWLETHRPTPTHHQAHQPDDTATENNPWEGMRTLPIKPYRGLRLRKWVSHG